MRYAGKAVLVVAIVLSGSGDVKGARESAQDFGDILVYYDGRDLVEDYDSPRTFYFDFDTSANGDTTPAKKLRD